MPSSMIHLLTAHKVDLSGSLLFMIGNVAPDAVANWQEKEIKHFRNCSNRAQALINLAGNTEKADDFAEGILLHLYLDWKWDTSVRDDFIKKVGDEWLLKYREELSLAGSYAFHHTDWSKSVWEQMDSYDAAMYGKVDGATAGELKDFICRNNRWHNDNNIGPSTAFTPEFIDEFTSKVADEYVKWRTQREIAYYNSLPVVFKDFIEVPELYDNEIELVCIDKKSAIPEKKYVPAYEFEIRKDGVRVGHIGLRIGYTDGLYYGGQIGYGIDEPYRGHGYAEKACRLLIPVIKAHGMRKLLITNNPINIASKRTCEKLGAKLIRVAKLPEWYDLYKDGRRYSNIFEWNIE